jgi:hypothetical protein
MTTLGENPNPEVEESMLVRVNKAGKVSEVFSF